MHFAVMLIRAWEVNLLTRVVQHWDMILMLQKIIYIEQQPSRPRAFVPSIPYISDAITTVPPSYILAPSHLPSSLSKAYFSSNPSL